MFFANIFAETKKFAKPFWSVHMGARHRIINDRIELYGVYIVFIPK